LSLRNENHQKTKNRREKIYYQKPSMSCLWIRKNHYAGGIRDEAEANQAIDKINKQYKKEERL